MIRSGAPLEEAVPLVGSYARIQWALDQVTAGRATMGELLRLLPKWWPMSDPDDTLPQMRVLWTAAWLENKRRYIRDGKPLPRTSWLTIFRGQDPVEGNDPRLMGVSWTLDDKIAERFARGAATRQKNRGGVVYAASIERRKVLAYLTARNEEEVIVNTSDLRPLWDGRDM